MTLDCLSKYDTKNTSNNNNKRVKLDYIKKEKRIA